MFSPEGGGGQVKVESRKNYQMETIILYISWTLICFFISIISRSSTRPGV